MAVTRQNLIDRLNAMRAATPANPIKKSDFAQFLEDWLNYMTNDGAYSAGVLEQWKTETLALQNAKLNADITLANNAAAQALASAAAASLVAQGQATAYPSVKPTILVDFRNSNQIDSRLKYNPRTETGAIATYIASNGYFAIAKKGAPRFTYDPVTLRKLGLLIEWSNSTNQVLYNRDFTQNVWGKGANGTSVTLASTLTPFKTQGLNKICEGTNNGSHLFSQSISYNSGTNRVGISYYVKALETTKIQVEHNAVDGATTYGFRYVLDLVAGTVVSQQAIGTAAFSFTNIEIENGPMGGFIVKVLLTPATAVTQWGLLFYHLSSTNNYSNITYTGDGTSGYVLDIPQLENCQLTNISSAIITGATPVIRGGESIGIPSTGEAAMESVFPNCNEEGTIVFFAKRENKASFRAYYMLAGNTGANGSNRIQLTANDATAPYWEVFSNSTASIYTYNSSAVSPPYNSFFGSALVYNRTSMKGFMNGSQYVTGNLASFPSNFVNFSLANVNTIVSYFAYFPKRLTDAEAAALSNPSSLFGFLGGNQSPANTNLKSAAYQNVEDILKTTGRQEFSVDCTGASITRNIRRPYAFTFEIVDSSGVTLTTQPSASCVENTDNSLVFTGPAGKTLTYAITPVFEY